MKKVFGVILTIAILVSISVIAVGEDESTAFFFFPHLADGSAYELAENVEFSVTSITGGIKKLEPTNVEVIAEYGAVVTFPQEAPAEAGIKDVDDLIDFKTLPEFQNQEDADYLRIELGGVDSFQFIGFSAYLRDEDLFDSYGDEAKDQFPEVYDRPNRAYSYIGSYNGDVFFDGDQVVYLGYSDQLYYDSLRVIALMDDMIVDIYFDFEEIPTDQNPYNTNLIFDDYGVPAHFSVSQGEFTAEIKKITYQMMAEELASTYGEAPPDSFAEPSANDVEVEPEVKAEEISADSDLPIIERFPDGIVAKWNGLDVHLANFEPDRRMLHALDRPMTEDMQVVYAENNPSSEHSGPTLGYVNKDYDLVIPPIYRHAGNFSEGMAFVIDEDWQYKVIDKENNTLAIIGTNDDYGYCQSAAMPQFENGYAVVPIYDEENYNKITLPNPVSIDVYDMDFNRIVRYSPTQHDYIYGHFENCIENDNLSISLTDYRLDQDCWDLITDDYDTFEEVLENRWTIRDKMETHVIDLAAAKELAERGIIGQITVTNGSNVRSGPNADFAQIGKVKAGDVFEAIEQDESGWYAFMMEDGQIGYVSPKMVEFSN